MIVHCNGTSRFANDSTIIVKFVGKNEITDDAPWCRQFPNNRPVLGRCRFTFDPSETKYDWLVVYDELPPNGEALRCPRANTMLITTEPASIKVYGSAYTSQFGHVLTSQEIWALRHQSRILHQPGLRWYYGLPLIDPKVGLRTYDQMKDGPNQQKDAIISTVCSNKAMRHTLHHRRCGFIQTLKSAVPELDIFGRGVRDINDKSVAMDRYKYHVAIENYCAPHHITEKLTDTFLAGALPFYFGAPNTSDYFPEDSFIPIDIRRVDEAIDRIKHAISNDEYGKRKHAIDRSRQITLDQQNLFAVLTSQIDRLDAGERGGSGEHLINRKVLRNRNPLSMSRYYCERYSVKARAWYASLW